MLCDRCKKREATLHFTEVNSAGVDSKTTNLCIDCGGSFDGAKEARHLAAAWSNARCRYCGGHPHTGGPDLVRGMSFMCQPCAEEYFRFLGEKWPGFGDVAITKEQIARIHRTDKPAVFR
jgi:protein-arginine kinase activator protein McsA